MEHPRISINYSSISLSQNTVLENKFRVTEVGLEASSEVCGTPFCTFWLQILQYFLSGSDL